MDILAEITKHTVYKVKSGSASYGLNTPESDEDTLGVFMPTPENILGVTDNIGKHVRMTEPDENYKTISEFIAFVRDGSSFWVETLFVREEDILVLKPHFEPFVTHRKLFLTKALVTKSLGFMSAMANRSVSQKSIPSTNHLPEEEQAEALNKSKQKNLCHAVRVGNMIVEMLNDFDLRVYRPEEREALLNIKTGVTPLDDAKAIMAERIGQIEEKLAITTIPDVADENVLNSMLAKNIVQYWYDAKMIDP